MAPLLHYACMHMHSYRDSAHGTTPHVCGNDVDPNAKLVRVVIM